MASVFIAICLSQGVQSRIPKSRGCGGMEEVSEPVGGRQTRTEGTSAVKDSAFASWRKTGLDWRISVVLLRQSGIGTAVVR
jgi:hypothetical protein